MACFKAGIWAESGLKTNRGAATRAKLSAWASFPGRAVVQRTVCQMCRYKVVSGGSRPSPHTVSTRSHLMIHRRFVCSYSVWSIHSLHALPQKELFFISTRKRTEAVSNRRDWFWHNNFLRGALWSGVNWNHSCNGYSLQEDHLKSTAHLIIYFFSDISFCVGVIFAPPRWWCNPGQQMYICDLSHPGTHL